MSRYFWLKMRRDFFKRHDIRILEGLPEGKELVLFYVKLLVESVDHEGALRYSKTKPYTPEMLAVVTDSTPEFVAQALETLAELELIADDPDGTIVLPHALDLIGSAADNDNAKRQARYRENHKNNADSNAIVTHPVTTPLLDTVTDSNATVTHPVTNSNESKSKSKSKSIDIEKEYKEKNEPSPRARFVAPTHDEILDYMTSYSFEKGLSVDPVIEAEKFFNYYDNIGWRVGKGKTLMKNWRLAASNWLLNAKDFVKPDPATNPFTDILGGEF